MLRPHPRPTLFPYTTLFRSFPPRLNTGMMRLAPFSAPDTARGLDDHVQLIDRNLLFHGEPEDSRPRAREQGKDRKSTRLNSSHVRISYAVFCLKKKIKS